MKPIISVIIPIFNEEKNIPVLHQRLSTSLKKITLKYEIIFVNDGSKDHSLMTIQKIQKKDKKIKLISFSRNFGHMPAIEAGLHHAAGKKVVIMDADLQDPPEVIPLMYQQALKGFDIVYGIKEKRKESLIKKSLFSLFYRVLNNVSSYKMPLDAGAFSLLDEKVVKILLSLTEKNKYFSGLRAWVGFKQTGVIYERGARYQGKAIPISKLFKLALDGIFSFSYVPLRISSLLGFILALLSFFLILLVMILRIFFSFGIIGWASTLITILFIGGIQLITLGIIGEYLARIYDEVKNRPPYIISEKKGFKK